MDYYGKMGDYVADGDDQDIGRPIPNSVMAKECPIQEDFKQKIIDTPETDTVVLLKSSNNPSRVLRTPGAEKILELEKKGATLEEMIPYISGKVSARGWQEANVNEGMFPGGQVVGRIHDNPTVAELIQRIIFEELEAIEQLTGR